MKTTEILRQALGSLGVHKLRSVLTIAGITIGVFSVIGVMTAVSALRGSVESGLSFLGANVFQISKWPAGIQVGGMDWAKIRKRRPITYAEAQRYQALMQGTTTVNRLMTWGDGQAFYSGRQTTPNLDYGGTDENFLETNQASIALGRNFTADDVDLRRPVALIGQTVIDDLFPFETPIGRKFRVNTHVYTVVGTLTPKGTSFGYNQDEIVLVPITRFIQDNGPEHSSLNIATEATSQAVYEDTLAQGIMAMRIARRLRPGEENTFESYSNDSLVSAFAKVADSLSAGAFVVSAIALLAAGVGIMNIMLVSVTERTQEIGVRKSLGARRSDILAQFLLEAVALSLVGGIAGIALGVAAGDGAALKLHAAIVFPWGWTIVGLAVCTAIGVGFGFYPALRAARLDPIEALRHE